MYSEVQVLSPARSPLRRIILSPGNPAHLSVLNPAADQRQFPLITCMKFGERGVLVVESLTSEREVVGSIPTSAMLCH